MTCRHGDIVRVPFPFSDLSATKKSPVLALTDADRYGDFLAVGIASHTHYPDSIPITAIDITSGGQPAENSVRIDRIIPWNHHLAPKNLRIGALGICRPSS